MIKFGTDGWRAIISDEFTFENVRLVARAIALYVKTQFIASPNKPLIVGYDPRFLADKFAQEVAKVMAQAGISSYIVEYDTPTPVVAWSVIDKKACGAVMLTASHNPPQYCGIKFIPDYAGPANAGITKEIEANLGKDVPSAEKSGKIESFDPKPRYFNYIKKFVDAGRIKRAKLKVVIDPMYGSGRGYLDLLLQKLGCQTEELHAKRDVLFGGHNPEPCDVLLGGLKSRVAELKANLGLALDGDADRFGLVDEKGKFYSPNQVITMLFKYLMEDKRKKGSVVRSIGTTHMIDALAQKHDIKVHETPVGFKYIAEIMMKEPVIIGGEESGGLSVQGHIPEKDGTLAGLLLTEMVAIKKKSVSQIWAEIEKEIGHYYTHVEKVKLPEEKKQKLLINLQNTPQSEIAGAKVIKTRIDDGVKFYFADGGWILVRPSGTEPLVRIYAESKNQDQLNKIVAQIKSLL